MATTMTDMSVRFRGIHQKLFSAEKMMATSDQYPDSRRISFASQVLSKDFRLKIRQIDTGKNEQRSYCLEFGLTSDEAGQPSSAFSGASLCPAEFICHVQKMSVVLTTALSPPY